ANLTIGDFDSGVYPIPAELKKNITEAYTDNQTNYPPADGVLALRERVSVFLKERYGLQYASNEVLITGGSRPLIYATYLALVDPGDTVIYPAPSWNNNHYCHLTQAKEIVVPTLAENNFMPKATDLEPHLKGATLLALCSPLNPTGTMFDKKDLEEICDLVITENQSRKEGEKPLYILYDQIYSLLTFGKEHVNPVSLRPELRDFTIFIDGASKCFAATGVRVGWGFGPEKIMAKMRSITGHMGAWAPKAEQVALAKFLADAGQVDAFLADFKGRIRKSLQTLYDGFAEMQKAGLAVEAIEPMGAIYLTLKIDYLGRTTPNGEQLKSASDINFYLIKEAGAALVPFSSFGTEADVCWFRASVGGCALEDIEAMVPRVRAALEKLS
ncbi:MAG: aminotransferase class I/II-fold pyridoxal phosphate-dependent enzyme, partial [Mucilaginibacter polytrichastri]|nr:aminotransferase class I/II-fold pyridoxal phosphate-dependent enzyme [Mucilaginibacter polytrichastri]